MSGCKRIVEVADDSELTAALASALGGDCLAIGEGSYGSHVLPSGVSLLGDGWDRVTVGDLTLQHGRGVVREVTARSLSVSGGGELEICQVAIRGSVGDGLQLGAGASASLQNVTIEEVAQYGIAAFDASRLDIAATLIRKTGGPGLWSQCGSEPGTCQSSKILVDMRRSHVEAAHIVGLSFIATEVTLDDVTVLDVTVGSNFEAGGAVSFAYDSTFEARDLVVGGAADFGVLVHESRGRLGEGSEVVGCLRGAWAQGSATELEVVGTAIRDNLGVGIGFAGPLAVTVEDTLVHGTRNISLPVLVNGVSAASQEVGDGIHWVAGATATLSGVTVGASDRVPILIDGPVGGDSYLEEIDLLDGDEAVGIVHQNLPPGATQPTIGPGVPEPLTTSEELYPTTSP